MTRRWNGWGDDGVKTIIPRAAIAELEGIVGEGRPTADATLSDVVAAIPAGRLPAHPLVTADPEDRLRHARGQSLGDWIALRSGQVGLVPDAVGRPTSPAEVRDLLGYAADVGARVVPYGGGTNVVGGLSPSELGPPSGGRPPVLAIDLERLAGMRAFDETSGLATFGAGVVGPALEAALRSRGRMLGHEPQSWEYSTLGGWIATRSAGQRALASAGSRPSSPAAGSRHPRAPSSSQRTQPRRPAPISASWCLARRAGWGSSPRRPSEPCPSRNTSGPWPCSSRTGSAAWRPSASWRAPACRWR